MLVFSEFHSTSNSNIVFTKHLNNQIFRKFTSLHHNVQQSFIYQEPWASWIQYPSHQNQVPWDDFDDIESSDDKNANDNDR